MGTRQSAYRGCLLGLAVGDAMGYTVDDRRLSQIQGDYGPGGLLGYDLVNGCADVTSHTQLAAYTANGLLLGLTRGQMTGQMAPWVRYVGMAQREWAAGQRTGKPPAGKSHCWVGESAELRFRRCMDYRMLDALCREKLGSPEEPGNRYVSPGALTAAVPVGLFFGPGRMEREEISRLGAETVALSHGSPLAFLTGAAVASLICGLVWQKSVALPDQITATRERLERQFGRSYPQPVEQIGRLLEDALDLAEDDRMPVLEAMEYFQCDSSPEVLAGAVYAVLASGGDFDRAMVLAVNHSGRSAAVGALAGAILGVLGGEAVVPDFYLEPLEPVELLRSLADDLCHGCPMDGKVFDFEWDEKYVRR